MDEVTFHDTVCNQNTFKDHIDDVDCHYKELLRMLETRTTCYVSIPYPYGKIIKETSSTPPDIFRIQNYTEKIQKLNCNQVYGRYTTIEIHEAIASGKLFKPLQVIPPLNTGIQFFNSTFQTAYPLIEFKPPNHSRINVKKNFIISNVLLDAIKKTTLPTNFSWMDNNDITKPMDQGTCGSCWAIAAATCVSDVFVASKRMPNPNISAGHILSCYPQKQCEGGNPYLAIRDMELNGAHTIDCIPNSLPIQSCNCIIDGPIYFPENAVTICIPPDLSKYNRDEAELIQSYLNSLYGTHDTADLSKESPSTIQHIIKEHIYKHGPVIAGFHVFKNFLKGSFNETSNVYIETEEYEGIPGIDYSDLDKDWIGSHAIVIVGWGEVPIKDKNVPFWICRNSWGNLWGDDGLFRIAMYGINKVSQFEFPSIIVSENRYGICGGVLLIKAGNIKTSTIMQGQLSHIKYDPMVRNLLFFSIIIICIISILLCIYNINSKYAIYLLIILFIIMLLIIYSLIF